MRRRNLVLTVLSGFPLLPSAYLHAEERPRMRVFRDPGCECCRGWVRHVEEAGFEVRLEERPRTDPIRRTSGAPPELTGCHMALHDRFAFEGHVPASAIRRFLLDPGPWRGLAVAGMPVGSPGMEVGGVSNQIYDVARFDAAGRWELFAKAKGSELI